MNHNIKNEVLTIFLKGKINSSNSDEVEQETSYLFTETEIKTRKVRGGKIITKTLTYDVYSVI